MKPDAEVYAVLCDEIAALWGTPPHCRGVDGDFRSQSMVSELVATSGFDRVRQLDDAAAAWLAKHRGH
jgi:hypothetical protein